MNEVTNIFEQMADPYYYDSPQAQVPVMKGGEMGSLAQAAYVPEPSWLSKLWQPWETFGKNLWETGVQQVEYASEKLPELLWTRGLQEVGLLPKQRVVSEGAGVTVIHTQAPQAGGAPAQPVQAVIPGTLPYYTPITGPQQAVGTGTLILIGAGLLVLYILFRK